MEKIYNPKDIEEKLYQEWVENDYFKPTQKINRNSFCIIMPPPNITGKLHMGHAFQQTIMDILIRYHRMQGDNTLWQMGLDHAGIATQMLVTKKIKNDQNIDITDFGRDNFIQECWKWKKKLTKNINYQVKRLGSSVDWSRERFTLDDNVKKGVRKVFIHLYKKNFIYRKKKLSNWDIKLQTVISDLELEHRSMMGKMWYIKYMIYNNTGEDIKNKYVIVATTRPETLLGDTALAIHPHDIRYKDLIGKFVIVPIVNRRIPIISDTFVDMNKGTGCVKITPAHDFNDYHVAIRNNLPMINIFTFQGNISNTFEVYDTDGNIINLYNTKVPNNLKGLNRFIAKKKIIQILKNMNYINNVIEEKITIVYGDRSNSRIEPLLTNQWYLRTSVLSKKAISAILNEDIQFFPKQYKNMYLSWMYNIQDWCISRQLWWGHKIPAWYDMIGNIYVGKNEEDIRFKYCISSDVILIQDPDVLDTWFSSSLWTFLSLDWPHKNNLLNIFHPTTVIVSGFDIIFFWIARMIMMTIHIFKDFHNIFQIPFKHIYITGLIKDELGNKMSKSKGNVIDPLDIIDGIDLPKLLQKKKNSNIKDILLNKIIHDTKKKFPCGIKSFGADVLRFTFTSMSSINRHINWDMNRLQGYRNFCNKIWNACRFIILNVHKKEICNIFNNQSYFFFNIWILTELNNTIKLYRHALDSYRFDIASNVLYDFIWNKFCNWYIEIVKVIFQFSTEKIIKNTKYTLIYTFEIILKLSHPIIPFITEYLWKYIKDILNISGKTIMLQNFPIFYLDMLNNNSIKIMNWIQNIILFLRKFRTDFNISKNILFSLFIYNCHVEYKKILLYYKQSIKNLIYLKDIIFLKKNDILPKDIMIKVIDGIKVFIILDYILNIQIKYIKINQKINIINKKIKKLKKIILNLKNSKKNQKNMIIKQTECLNLLLFNKEEMINKKNNFLKLLNIKK